jgi:hypothetical protein
MRDATYDLYLQLITKLLTFGMLAFFTLFALGMMFGFMPDISGPQPVRLFYLIWLGIAAWLWYWLLTTPYKIVVSGGRVEFVSVLRRRRLFPTDIHSIKPISNQYGFLNVRTAHGTFRMLNQFDGFHRFLTDLETTNPRVELRGC